MEYFFHSVEDADVYIDNVEAFYSDWQHHLQMIDTIFNQLQENGSTVNPLKCELPSKSQIGMDIG